MLSILSILSAIFTNWVFWAALAIFSVFVVHCERIYFEARIGGLNWSLKMRGLDLDAVMSNNNWLATRLRTIKAQRDGALDQAQRWKKLYMNDKTPNPLP